jgi:hypothetical protein
VITHKLRSAKPFVGASFIQRRAAPGPGWHCLCGCRLARPHLKLRCCGSDTGRARTGGTEVGPDPTSVPPP